MTIDWIAVDWGTSNLRIWAMNNHGDIIDAIESHEGMAKLQPHEFEPIFISHIYSWLNDDHIMPIIACGMVGARQGWQEAPYAIVPTLPALEFIKVNSKYKNIDMRIIAGVQQNQPADVMRGEETQIAGFLNLNPDFAGIICLPGTHAKWVEIYDGQIIRFKTCLTGELFAILSQNSVLRHSMGRWDKQIFSQYVQLAFASPANALNNLFEIRADDLLHQQSNGIARLSATLIGAEIANMQDFWQDKHITLIGAGQLTQHYHDAFDELNINSNIQDGSDLTLQGLKHAYDKIVRTS